MTTTRRTTAARIPASSQANGTESAKRPASFEIQGKIWRAYQRSTNPAGKAPSQENMKVGRQRSGKIHDLGLSDKSVKNCKIPVLRLTIRLRLGYDPLLSLGL